MIATHNPGKLAEMRELLAPYGIEAVSAGELGLAEPDETGTTFQRQRPHQGARPRRRPQSCRPSPTIPALRSRRSDGAPGIHSARWAGPNKDFDGAMARVERLLQERGATRPQRRGAHFVSALCVAWPDGASARVRGACRRHARVAAARPAGFGYDPMFLPDGHDAHVRRDDARSRSTDCRRWASGCRTAPALS